MKILKGLLSLLLCLCLITPMGSAIVALNDGGIANMGSQTNSGSPTSAPSVTPAPSDTDTPVEAPDYAALYNDLMAAATFAEAHALLEGLTDEQLSAFIDSLTEEQYAALEEHIDALIAAAEEDGDLEYVYTTVNFTNVAPLLDPVCGSPTRGASVSDDEAGSGNGDNGMVITKNAVANEDGTYTITLEAYATGDKVITEVTEDIPTDIVLVLDQSGSMAELFPIKVSAADPTLGANPGYYKYKLGIFDFNVYYRNGNWYYNVPILGQQELNDHDTIYLTRLDALKNTVSTFANAVAEKAKGEDGTLETGDDVNHRIAVVGFASSGTEYNEDKYENTEVFVGATQYTYGNSAIAQYSNALQSMNTSIGKNNIANSIKALDAYGGTFTDLGMEMANGILNVNKIEEGTKRNRVVIVFTDGLPGTGKYDSTVGNAAISQGSTAKSTYGATVYTVGIFDGADATSAGNSSGNDTQKANWFMQNLSSNNGAVQSPSYYLSAGDADALNDIFEKISQQIETGGSSTTLSEDTVIRDIIAPAFTLPKGATADSITLETWKYNGPDSAWTKNADAMGATATVFGSQVSVTGFNFAENYVGTVTNNGEVTYRGHKLVISFTVSPKADFLGGNNVYTNANAGVYENSTAINPVLTFERPQVNVPIGEVSVTASDKNVYLLNGLTAEQLKEGATVTVGGVSLNLAAADNNYGLETWQTEYVNISVVIKDASGNAVTVGIDELSDDTTYSITVTVSPKPDTGYDKDGNLLPGTLATQQSGYDEGTINVFKPVLTFADSEVWYGGQYTDYTANYKSVAWKHGTDEANTETMGNAPELTLDYATTPVNAIVEGYIAVPDDIPVNVSVKIGDAAIDDHVSFVHDECEHSGCDFGTEGAVPCKFILHVNTCSLTVNKAIAEGKLQDPEHQSFIFKVHYQGIPDGEGTILPSADYNVLIVGAGSRTIVGLPVGSYTVSEDTNWSWRYTLVGENHVSTELSAGNSTATVTMTNRLNNEFWLSDEAVATNVFNSNSSPEYSPIPAIIPGKEDLTDEAD
ncbi:MAG: VWA domain-containing protein [Clostridium sp.]|nr:VWA domain-containing protein [Clostridium sp.]